MSFNLSQVLDSCYIARIGISCSHPLKIVLGVLAELQNQQSVPVCGFISSGFTSIICERKFSLICIIHALPAFSIVALTVMHQHISLPRRRHRQTIHLASGFGRILPGTNTRPSRCLNLSCLNFVIVMRELTCRYCLH